LVRALLCGVDRRKEAEDCCLEEIAFHKDIYERTIAELAKPLSKNQYGQYLIKIAKRKFLA